MLLHVQTVLVRAGVRVLEMRLTARRMKLSAQLIIMLKRRAQTVYVFVQRVSIVTCNPHRMIPLNNNSTVAYRLLLRVRTAGPRTVFKTH